MIKQVLKGHESAETGYLVKDYPYGFRLRCEIRYWIETKPGTGQRFCSQTLNPKTGKWNAPKKSTYSIVLGMGLNEEGHVKTHGLSAGWSKEENIKEFEALFGPLSDYQTKSVKFLRALNAAQEVITYTVKPVVDGEPRQTEEEKQAILNKALAYGYAKVDGKV